MQAVAGGVCDGGGTHWLRGQRRESMVAGELPRYGTGVSVNGHPHALQSVGGKCRSQLHVLRSERDSGKYVSTSITLYQARQGIDHRLYSRVAVVYGGPCSLGLQRARPHDRHCLPRHC